MHLLNYLRLKKIDYVLAESNPGGISAAGKGKLL